MVRDISLEKSGEGGELGSWEGVGGQGECVCEGIGVALL